MNKSFVISVVAFTFFAGLLVLFAFLQKREADTQRNKVDSNEVKWNAREKELLIDVKRKDSTINVLTSKIDSLEKVIRK